MSDTTLPPKRSVARAVQPRDSVVFFRSSGHFSPVGTCWHLHVRGCIFASAPKRIRNRVLLTLFKRVVKPEKKLESRQRFLDRAHLFLQDTKKGKSVPIAIAERSYILSDTLPNGQFETTLTVQQTELDSTVQQDPYGRRFVQFCAHLPENDARLFAGEIELIPPEGISVISDVDDTIKISNVDDKKELLANTFTREFRSVEGMRSLYQTWAQSGLSFHYVSASPWPLYAPLVNWLDADGFPLGTMHLRHVRLRDLRKDKKKDDSYFHKKAAIEGLLRQFPLRRFILCGDSGERDAELYGEIARDFGQQIQHVAIRRYQHAHNGESAKLVAERLSHLDRSRWTLFEHPQELADLMPG